MEKWKEELYGIKTYTRFLDTSNTRYQSHSYAVAELLTYYHLYPKLIQEVIDGKMKSSEENHVEKTVLKGLKWTQAEMVAIALYRLAVSWPYLCIARGEGKKGSGKVINLLSTIDLHCCMSTFCHHIATNPHILLDLNSDILTITLDGWGYQDAHLVEVLWLVAPELGNDLNKMVTAMFSGAANGWDIFTAEFAIGGLIDSLTPAQLQLLFIPATNDANEGGLGSWHIHLCYNPNSTTATFSAKACLERNDTENFILIQMTDDNHQHVMHLVWKKNLLYCFTVNWWRQEEIEPLLKGRGGMKLLEKRLNNESVLCRHWLSQIKMNFSNWLLMD